MGKVLTDLQIMHVMAYELSRATYLFWVSLLSSKVKVSKTVQLWKLHL